MTPSLDSPLTLSASESSDFMALYKFTLLAYLLTYIYEEVILAESGIQSHLNMVIGEEYSALSKVILSAQEKMSAVGWLCSMFSESNSMTR